MIHKEKVQPGITLANIRLPQDPGYRAPQEVKPEVKQEVVPQPEPETPIPAAPKRGRPRRDQIDETDPK